MADITPIIPGFWRWDGTDADHGFPIVGYVVALAEGLALVDPPGTSASAEELRALGRPWCIVVTGRWHVRGAPHWAREFGIPIAGLLALQEELTAERSSLDVPIADGQWYAGWQALRLSAHAGEKHFDELAFYQPSQRVLIVGDLLVERDDGRVGLGPVEYTGLEPETLRPAVARLQALRPEWVLSGHLGPRRVDAAFWPALLPA